MTALDQIRPPSSAGVRPRNGRSAESIQQTQPSTESKTQNVGDSERTVSVASGTALAILGLARQSLPGLLIAGVGGAMIYRGVSGHCHLYEALGVDTTQSQRSGEALAERGLHVEQAMLINRPIDQLYSFWRNFQNLPQFMQHLKRVDVIDERRSHWVAQLSRMAGGNLEWDAEITRDEPNAVIAWRSLPGSEIQTTGEVRFNKALGDRGSEVHVFMDFLPPFGAAASLFPSLFNKAAGGMIRQDLRRFKQLMEVGEIPSLDGQPHGTCAGWGIRYRD